MSKPRRGTQEVFYDTFADWTLDDQAAALRILEQLHRQARRDAGRKKPAPGEDLTSSAEMFASTEDK